VRSNRKNKRGEESLFCWLLGEKMEKFIKYQKTLHLPNSLTVQSDDKMHKDTRHMDGVECVVLLKMDGENTSLYPYPLGMHARSINYGYHESRTWIKLKHAEIQHLIPPKWRVCGENMFAEHSIKYNSLSSYFYIFSIWDDANNALSWDDTMAWASKLGFPTVAVLYRGVFSMKKIKEVVAGLDTKTQEGIVVRPADQFHFNDFKKVVGKWVRNDHVQTNKHWSHQKVKQNGLKK